MLFNIAAIYLLSHLALAAPLNTTLQTRSDLVERWTGKYYSGPASSFPAMSTWKSFSSLFEQHKQEMLSTGNTGEDVGRMWNAINWAARDIGVEERVILCIILQESSGNVGVRCTRAPDGSHSCGLMQAAESPGYEGQHGLSQDQISAMIYAGTGHYKENLKQVGNADNAPTIYRAARLYNSGDLNDNNLSDGRGATDSYVSDIANCLMGASH